MASGPIAGLSELDIPAVHAGSFNHARKNKPIPSGMHEHDLL